MADQEEPKARYPKQEVSEGQKHGYIGDVEVYDPPEQEPGHSNVEGAQRASSSTSTRSQPSRSTRTRTTAKDVQPDEKPIAGATGTIGGTTENVGPKR